MIYSLKRDLILDPVAYVCNAYSSLYNDVLLLHRKLKAKAEPNVLQQLLMHTLLGLTAKWKQSCSITNLIPGNTYTYCFPPKPCGNQALQHMHSIAALPGRLSPWAVEQLQVFSQNELWLSLPGLLVRLEAAFCFSLLKAASAQTVDSAKGEMPSLWMKLKVALAPNTEVSKSLGASSS